MPECWSRLHHFQGLYQVQLTGMIALFLMEKNHCHLDNSINDWNVNKNKTVRPRSSVIFFLK